MTVVNPKSISGINSITMASGSDNLLTIHTTNTTERLRINSSGDVIVGSGITVSPDGNIFATGVTTSTTFVGDLTGTASKVSVATNNDNTTYRVPFTSSDTGNVSLYSDTTSGMTYNPSTGAFTVNGVLTSGSVSSGAISGSTGTFSSHVSLGDSDELRFGDDADLVIQHNGNDSVISDNGTGDLYIRGSDDIFIQNSDGSKTFAAFNDGATIELYNNNVKVIETNTTGIQVGFDGAVSNPTIKLPDDGFITWGTSDTAYIQGADAGSGGYLKFNANNGLRARIDGDGLKFGSDTAAANALNDYEEGTYTPVISFSGSNYTYSSDYTLRSPHSTSNSDTISYVKIGSMVYLNFVIFWNTSTTARYAMTLPFTARGSAYALCITPASFRVEISGDTLGTLGLGNNSTGFDTYRITGASSNGGHGNIPLTQHSEVYYTMCYEAL